MAYHPQLPFKMPTAKQVQAMTLFIELSFEGCRIIGSRPPHHLNRIPRLVSPTPFLVPQLPKLGCCWEVMSANHAQYHLIKSLKLEL